MVTTYRTVVGKLNALKNPTKAKFLAGYFKTGEGEYGAGDVFLGLTVPLQRKIAKDFVDISFPDIQKLLASKVHEYRFTALQILVLKYAGTQSSREKKQVFDFYLKNRKYINNWDLVDTSAHEIVGAYLHDKDRSVLYKLAMSKNVWDRRIAIVATYRFICNKDFSDTEKIAELLLADNHDLIHKAAGWMLREMGKRSRQTLVDFLAKHYKHMPRTMLRYSIEHFDEGQRKRYLQGLV